MVGAMADGPPKRSPTRSPRWSRMNSALECQRQASVCRLAFIVLFTVDVWPCRP